MAETTITIDRFQVRRSSTPGYRPGDNGSRPLDDGERFINFADGIELIGDGMTAPGALFPYPLIPTVGNVLGLAEALAAKASVAYTLVADQNYICVAGDVQVGIKPLTAARTISLPNAEAYPFGQDIVIADESGSCSETLTITIQPGAGTGDIIGGPDGPSLIILSSPYQSARFRRGAANLWIRS